MKKTVGTLGCQDFLGVEPNSPTILSPTLEHLFADQLPLSEMWEDQTCLSIDSLYPFPTKPKVSGEVRD